MSIKLAGLLEKIERGAVVKKITYDLEVYITTIERISNKDKTFYSDVLYYGKTSDFLDILVKQNLPRISILCEVDSEIPDMFFKSPKVNFLTIKKSFDIFDVISQVNCILNDSNRMMFRLKEIIGFLANSNSLQEIVDVGEKILGGAICITSNSLKVIAISKNIEAINTKISSSNQNTGYFPFEYVLYKSNENMHQIIDKAGGPFFWFNHETKEKLILGKVMVDKKRVAVISVVEKDIPFNEESLELVSILSNSISVQMQKANFYKNYSGKFQEDYIFELLDSKIMNDCIMNEKKRLIEMDFKKHNYLLVIDFSYFDNEIILISYIQEILAKLFFSCKSTVYSDYIVALVNTDKESDMFLEDLEKLKRFLVKYNLKCGMSRNIKKNSDIKEFYSQAKNAIKFGNEIKEKEVLYNYEDYSIFSIMDICSKTEKYSILCHPSIFSIMEYDKMNNTDYTKSLYAYVKNLKNITEAANDIFAHRNTIIYRIKKIEEIAEINLNDDEIIFQLYFSFKIIEYVDKEIAKTFFNTEF